MLIMLSYAIFFIIFWLIFLTLVFFKLRNHYYRLISRTKKTNLDDILDLILQQNKKNQLEIEVIKKKLLEEIDNSKSHLQKIGLVRFNPFERSGSDQSFVISFLDQENNGIILNFIYTKEGLRVYTKKVEKGKGKEYPLTEEEKKVIEKS